MGTSTQDDARDYPDASIKETLTKGLNQPVSVNGQIATIRPIESENGEPMCVCMIEADGEQLEVIVIPNTYANDSRHIKENSVVNVCGTVCRHVNVVRLEASHVMPAAIEIEWTSQMRVADLQEHGSITQGGIYLWIQNGVISYVGEARCYRDRFAEHLRCMVAGSYSLWKFDDNPEDPYKVMRENGVPGLRPDLMSWASAWEFEKKCWSLSRVIDQNRIRDVLATIDNMRFVLGYAPRLVADTKLRREIEGGLISQICKYYNLPMGRTTAIGKISNYPTTGYHLKHGGDGGSMVSALLAKPVPDGLITSA